MDTIKVMTTEGSKNDRIKIGLQRKKRRYSLRAFAKTLGLPSERVSEYLSNKRRIIDGLTQIRFFKKEILKKVFI